MAIGKANVNFNPNKISINFGKLKIVENGKLSNSYKEKDVAEYIDIDIDYVLLKDTLEICFNNYRRFKILK